MSKRFCIILLFLISLSSFGQEITAAIKTVSSVLPGGDFTVEITVNKPGITGFMKYFQDLPAGYIATDVDSKGGSFTFADNGAKIIWISPPATDQFVISYKITTPANGTGSVSLGGKFSYVVGSERKTFEIVPQVISVGQAKTVSKEPVKEVVKENTSPPVETKPIESKPTEIQKTTAEPVKSTPPPVTETKTSETPKPVETKKETPPPIVTTPAKAPVTAAAAVIPGKTYRVQIGAFASKPHLDGVPEPSSVVLDNGMTKYFSGNFKTYEEAVKRKKEMIEKSFSGAFIVSFENGKIVK